MADDDGFIDFSNVIPKNPINLGRFIFNKPPVIKKKEEIKEETPQMPLSRKQKFAVNLIKLYEQHECLWNTNDKDFLNLPLKKNIWTGIAKTLGREGELDYIKRYIHTLRYKVNLQKVQQLEATLYQDFKPPEKLFYTDQLKFLNHTLHQRFKKKDEKKLPQQVDKKLYPLLKKPKPTLRKPIGLNFSERLRIYNCLRNCKNTERDCLKYETYKRLEPVYASKLKSKCKVKEQLELQHSDDGDDDMFPAIDSNLSECNTSSWNTFVHSVPKSETKLQSFEASKIIEANK